MTLSLFETFKEETSVFCYLEPTNPRRIRNRKGHWEITGGCPLCDECSRKSGIITVKTPGSMFYCRKVQGGGSVIDALALKMGIISCSQLKTKQYSPEQRQQIIAAVSAEVNSIKGLS